MTDNVAELARGKSKLVAAMEADRGWHRRIAGYTWAPFRFGYVRIDGVFVCYMAFRDALNEAVSQWRYSLDDMRTHIQIATDVLDALAAQSTERVEVTE